jgi:hypothetical protein
MSVKKSIYEQFFIESDDKSKTVDISQGVVSFDYYEDIFSPTVTAKVMVVNTGNTIKGKDGKLQSIYNGLPLRGGERVAIKVAGNSPTNPGLDFATNSKDSLYVSSISNLVSETQRESFVLNLVSKEALINETTRVPKKFSSSSTIDSSVTSILKNYLKTDNIGKIDKTSNKYGFIGNLRKPFSILVWLASKAVPSISGDGTAGFLFYQSKDGFQFRSIDNLIMESSKASYTYTEVNQSNIERNNDFNILKYKTVRNQNLLEKLRLGAYSSTRVFYNPLTFEFTSPSKGLFKLSDYSSKLKNLGDDLSLPKVLDSSNNRGGLGNIPTRIFTQILDIGTVEKDVSTDINADPSKYQSQSIMRYNTLFTQSLSVTIPSNTNLRAGDIIECQFPKISFSNSKEFDDDQSGLYMIKELCHHFDTEGSYTSMELVRDTFGKHGKNNK